MAHLSRLLVWSCFKKEGSNLEDQQPNIVLQVAGSVELDQQALVQCATKCISDPNPTQCGEKCGRDAAIEADPTGRAKCGFDCMDKFNIPFSQAEKCNAKGSSCFDCFEDCQSGAGRNMAGTAMVITLFFPLIW